MADAIRRHAPEQIGANQFLGQTLLDLH
jgi:hypothetical protein